MTGLGTWNPLAFGWRDSCCRYGILFVVSLFANAMMDVQKKKQQQQIENVPDLRLLKLCFAPGVQMKMWRAIFIR